MTSIWTIRRSATDTKVAGLCGGVAEHWGIDPVLVRVGWVLLALSGGVGLVLYVAGWLLIPVTGRDRAPLDDLLGEGTRRWPREVWVTLVIVACLVAFAAFGSLSPFGFGPAVLLAAVWYFGFYKQRQDKSESSRSATPGALPPAGVPGPAFVPHAGPATPFTEAAAAWRQRIEQHVEQSSAALAGRTTWPTPPAASPTPAPSPSGSAAAAAAPDPEWAEQAAFLAEPDPAGLYSPVVSEPAPLVRSGSRLSARRLRLGGLAVLGLALAGLGYADRLGAGVPMAAYPAVALLVVGLTLVAATWWGRARGILPVGLLLAPVVVLSAVLGPVTHLDQWAETGRHYDSVAALPAAGDFQQIGELKVDLSKLPTTEDASYTAHLGTGELEVVVPADANVVLDYEVRLGAVMVDGNQVIAGNRLTGTYPETPATNGKPTLTLHLEVDQGQLEVRR